MASLDHFLRIGLPEEKAKESLRNASLSQTLAEIIEQAEIQCSPEVLRRRGVLLYHVATRLKVQCRAQTPLLIRHISNENIRTEQQLTAAMDFLLHHVGVEFCEGDFLDAAGVGVVVSRQQIQVAVSKVIDTFKEQLLKERYRFNQGKLMAEAKKDVKWADGADLKKEMDLQVLLLLGPRTPEELVGGQSRQESAAKSKAKPSGKATQEKKSNSPPASSGQPAQTSTDEEGAATIEELMRSKVHFHKPGENYKTDGYMMTEKTLSLLKKHLKETDGKVVTRFPPEPNGILHIGHAKAININFGYAKTHKGICYLRYDDTNPEKEEERFFVAIQEMVEWLGYKPYKITHASDYFHQLYDWGLDLIWAGHAYVCHQRPGELKGFNPPPSPWRERPIDESLALFQDMRNGKLEEGEATLRMKVTLAEGKVDPVAYRIKYVPHHRTGSKWCIYPTYDYTHCLCDSLENITHSLCTKEFQSRRSSYYWLCNVLDVYCPVQWEYGRLNISYTVVSKRKILKLISEKIVRDWDDPRLFTLPALRRRGFPAEAINAFVAQMGLTTAKVTVDPHMVEASVRDVLNTSAPRAMAVLEPLKLRIVNWTETDWPTELLVPDFPADASRGQHRIPFDSVFFIDRSDYKQEDERGFKRLTKTQSVGLKYVSGVISLLEEKLEESGAVSELLVRCERLVDGNKPKAFIHWVAQPLPCQIRLYERLFFHKNPEDSSQVPDGFLSDCNPASLRVISKALVDVSVSAAKVYDKFQFERIGFFSLDPDSTPQQLVFNRTVLLKEDAGKRS